MIKNNMLLNFFLLFGFFLICKRDTEYKRVVNFEGYFELFKSPDSIPDFLLNFYRNKEIPILFCDTCDFDSYSFRKPDSCNYHLNYLAKGDSVAVVYYRLYTEVANVNYAECFSIKENKIENLMFLYLYGQDSLGFPELAQLFLKDSSVIHLDSIEINRRSGSCNDVFDD
jgi:hypothetical protein